MTFLWGHERPYHVANDGAVLVFPDVPDPNYSTVGPGFRFPFVQDFGLAINRIADKDWRGQVDAFPAQIGNCFLTCRRHAHSNNDRYGQGRIDQAIAKLGLGAVISVKMQRVSVHRQVGEPDVVRFGDCSSRPVFIDITGLEILKAEAGILLKPAGPDLLHAIELSVQLSCSPKCC